MNVIIESKFNIDTEFAGFENFPIALTMGLGLVIGLIVAFASIDKIRSTNLQKKHVIYHYIARSIEGFHSEPERNYQKIVDSLNECVEYAEMHEVDFAHPKFESAIHEYTSKTNDYESIENRNMFIDNTFEEVIGKISDLIYEDESTELAVELDSPLPTNNEESSIKFIIRIISDFFTRRRVQIAIPIAILVSAFITLPILGPEITVLILGSYPILNSLRRFISNESENVS